MIVDHAAAVGAGTSDAQSLHRIEPVSVREEVEAAGFVLDAESTLLADRDDTHSIKVFDPSIKGEIDRVPAPPSSRPPRWVQATPSRTLLSVLKFALDKFVLPAGSSGASRLLRRVHQ
ncbi:hypothetical protein QTI17_30975 [Variovorax sp. J31P179]|uniref:hypothetical protein n=1 Tax=Variovorax sp. J31P179 TaxID=3053508 RepID=UPI002577BB36|nr:hypothetical protein [Variovorax sp. J31P179]MDM0085021.1 hypothetical protein [Variovorax sp. J31P179]